MTHFKNTLRAWRKILGEKNIVVDKGLLSSVQTATFATTQQVLAIILPANREEVQECVRIANLYKIPIYPISTGKNWGYGSRVPVCDNSVIMDLSRLNKIIDFNEHLAYITVEPGVTFRQLFEYLKKRGSKFLISTSGGTPDASLIGNALERGVGKGLYGDRSTYMCGLEVVLPTGECIHTGFTHYSNAKAGNVSRAGVGPLVDGLFTQSNFGVVTKATFWLLRKPRHSQIFAYSIKENSKLEDLINTLRKLKTEGTLRGNFLLSNHYRLLASKQQYPWKETKGKTPLPAPILNKLTAKWGIGVWNGEGIIFANSKQEETLLCRRIEHALSKKVDKLTFINGSIFIEYLSEISLRSLYWRKKTSVSKSVDPDRDKCGIIWISPAVPLESKTIILTIKIIEQDMTKYGFEPNLGINFVTERVCYITGAIIYDKEIAGEDEKAQLCYSETLKSLVKQGIYPYRLPINAMNALPKSYDDYALFIHRLKQALDPNDILAPGRYDSREFW